MTGTEKQASEAERQWDLDKVATYLQLPARTVRRLAKAGAIPGYRVGRRWRFSPERLRAWAAEGGTGDPAADRAAA